MKSNTHLPKSVLEKLFSILYFDANYPQTNHAQHLLQTTFHNATYSVVQRDNHTLISQIKLWDCKYSVILVFDYLVEAEIPIESKKTLVLNG